MSLFSQACLFLLFLAIVLGGVETESRNARPSRSRSIAAAKTTHPRPNTRRRAKKKSLTDSRSPHAKMVGKKMNLGTKGKWTVVHFWATWCRACKDVSPELTKLHKKFAPLGIEFVGVNLDSDRELMTEYMSEVEMNWAQIVTMDGWQSPIRLEYDIPSIPAVYLVNPKGEIVEAGIRTLEDGNNRILHHLSK